MLELWIYELNHSLTTSADDVVVVFFGKFCDLENRARAIEVTLADDSDVAHELQRSIDRCAADVLCAAANGFGNTVCVGVSSQRHDGLENHLPLRGHAEPLFPEEGNQFFLREPPGIGSHALTFGHFACCHKKTPWNHIQGNRSINRAGLKVSSIGLFTDGLHRFE